MKTAAGRGTGEATQGEERKVGRRLALYLSGENLICHFFRLFVSVWIVRKYQPLWRSCAWNAYLVDCHSTYYAEYGATTE